MAGKIHIQMQNAVTSGRTFDCEVRITGALAGDTVTIRLWQSAGVAPFLDATQQAPIDHTGTGSAFFIAITLAGPCRALLIADDTASAIPLDQGEKYVEVVP